MHRQAMDKDRLSTDGLTTGKYNASIVYCWRMHNNITEAMVCY